MFAPHEVQSASVAPVHVVQSAWHAMQFVPSHNVYELQVHAFVAPPAAKLAVPTQVRQSFVPAGNWHVAHVE